MQKSTILISDDQAHIRESLSLLLEPEGYKVIQGSSPKEIILKLQHHPCDLVLMDMNYSKDTTSGEEGVQLIKQIRLLHKTLPIIVMTAWANIELSVKAMNMGANDFVEKPWNNRRLLSLIHNQLLIAKERDDNERLSQVTKQFNQPEEIIATTPVMNHVMNLVKRTAISDANILLTGESGVGKSLIAGLIHYLSSRNEKPLISVNMGALADNLFESELFGHVKGAFTDAKSNRMGRFEMAEGGTLFLDEIANIPKALQAKLLRVLESNEFEPLGSSKTKVANVRIVSASNVDFDEEISQGTFRQDLLYRLNTITIHIPPLRERRDDILLLAESFLHKYTHKYRRPELTLSAQAQEAMCKYDWPGNVRELSHTIERAVLMAENASISESDLGLKSKVSASNIESMTLAEAEKYLIQQAMLNHNDNVADAAEHLGISRSALYRRLEKLTDYELLNSP